VWPAGVVSATAPQLELAEIERASRKPTDSLHAYDYYLRGLTKFHLASRAGLDEALPLFYKAIELDAEFASARGMRSVVLLLAQDESLAQRSRGRRQRGRAIVPTRRDAGKE
jgi:hypothetical protein